MPTSVASYIDSQLPGQSSVNYTTDYVGAVKLLENSGFSPFEGSGSPLNATLNQIFDRFVQKTGLDTTSNKLKDDFLQENPKTQQALNLYSGLENTFAVKSSGDQAAIVDFLNFKIDDFVTTNDSDQNNTLTQEESSLSDTLFQEIDADRNSEITGTELKDNFFNNFNELNNVLNYFQSNRGILIDVYG
jgi:hypothetical protein